MRPKLVQLMSIILTAALLWQVVAQQAVRQLPFLPWIGGTFQSRLVERQPLAGLENPAYPNYRTTSQAKPDARALRPRPAAERQDIAKETDAPYGKVILLSLLKNVGFLGVVVIVDFFLTYIAGSLLPVSQPTHGDFSDLGANKPILPGSIYLINRFFSISLHNINLGDITKIILPLFIINVIANKRDLIYTKLASIFGIAFILGAFIHNSYFGGMHNYLYLRGMAAFNITDILAYSFVAFAICGVIEFISCVKPSFTSESNPAPDDNGNAAIASVPLAAGTMEREGAIPSSSGLKFGKDRPKIKGEIAKTEAENQLAIQYYQAAINMAVEKIREMSGKGGLPQIGIGGIGGSFAYCRDDAPRLGIHNFEKPLRVAEDDTHKKLGPSDIDVVLDRKAPDLPAWPKLWDRLLNISQEIFKETGIIIHWWYSPIENHRAITAFEGDGLLKQFCEPAMVGFLGTVLPANLDLSFDQV